MGLPFLQSPRRIVAIFLSAAIAGQAAFADAAVSSVWSDRRRALPDAVNPALGQLPRIAPVTASHAPAGFSFAASIPAHLGTFRSSALSHAQNTVLLIQDVHLNGEAQANIAGAVTALLESGEVALVGLEGAEGPLGLERLAAAPDPHSLSLAADFLLEKNLISGGARAALAPDVAEKVIGLDDATLHGKNADAYRRAAPVAATVQRKISDARAQFARQKTAFNPRLRAFDRAVQEHRE
jgi:hypothetical protein